MLQKIADPKNVLQNIVAITEGKKGQALATKSWTSWFTSSSADTIVVQIQKIAATPEKPDVKLEKMYGLLLDVTKYESDAEKFICDRIRTDIENALNSKNLEAVTLMVKQQQLQKTEFLNEKIKNFNQNLLLGSVNPSKNN